MKLIEIISRVCKAVIKAKGGYVEESKLKYKTYSGLFNTCFVYYIIPYVFFHSFDVLCTNLQCRK